MLLLACYNMLVNYYKIYSNFFFYSVGNQNMGLGKYIDAPANEFLICPPL